MIFLRLMQMKKQKMIFFYYSLHAFDVQKGFDFFFFWGYVWWIDVAIYLIHLLLFAPQVAMCVLFLFDLIIFLRSMDYEMDDVPTLDCAFL
tara:strand:- start:34 stop:306 length:273 start_codon:yes stop_codon:yes gene_type:complete